MLESQIYNAFKLIKEINSITIKKSLNEWVIIILLDNKRYDDMLMNRLLDIEYDLQSRDEDPLLDFHYFPEVQNKEFSLGMVDQIIMDV